MAPPPNSSHPLHVLPLQSLAHDSDNGGGGGGFGGSGDLDHRPAAGAGSVPVPLGQSYTLAVGRPYTLAVHARRLPQRHCPSGNAVVYGTWQTPLAGFG